MNGRRSAIAAFPHTFFVDQNGNITGGTYEGSAAFEDWKSTVETELAELKGEKE